jgi:hypothetical protein
MRILVIDNGLFVSLAERLSEMVEKVGYFYDWQSGFPDGRELIIGEGIPKVKREKYLWPVIDDYDLFVFPDVWHGDLQEHLRKMGKAVWGSGYGSEVELARWRTREQLPALGLDVSPAQQVHGTKELRSYLKDHADQFVKVSSYRGIGETWFSQDLEMSEFQIRDIEDKCGALANVLDFICENSIPDALEVGYDGYCIDGKYPDAAVVGVEKKDQAYFGEFRKYDSLPENVRKVNDALGKLLQPHGYRQFLSTEIREKGKKSFLIDVTARHASPAGEVYCGMFENLESVLMGGANGVIVNPETRYKYGAQVILCSEWYSLGHWQPVRFPEEIRKFVKLYNHCRIDGVDYCVPQLANMKQLGSVVAFGNTPEEAIKTCKDRAEQMEGFDLETECDALDKAYEEMQKV